MARKVKRKKRSLLPFGDLMLPILGLVALGFLVFGIKIFFLPDKDDPYGKYVQEASPVPSQPRNIDVPIEEERSLDENDVSVEDGTVIAVPISMKEAEDKPRETSHEKSVSQPKPTSAPSRSSATAKNSSWYVQIGAFKQRSMAKALASKVDSKGYSTIIGEGIVNGTRYYRVWIPGGTSRNQATAVGERLKKLGYPYFVFLRR
jgi:cell division protein FtsN